MFKKVTALTLIITLMFSQTTYAVSLFEKTKKEEEKQFTSFSTATQEQCNAVIKDIINIAFTHDDSALYKYTNIMSTQTFDMYSNFVRSNRLQDSPGTFCIDFTYPEYSTTKDVVIMGNVKAYNAQNGYNTVYLFEFHVADDFIVGYQIWAY